MVLGAEWPWISVVFSGVETKAKTTSSGHGNVPAESPGDFLGTAHSSSGRQRWSV